MGRAARSIRPEEDARRAPRARTRLAAVIIVGQGDAAYDCVVRDWSEEGVRVELPPTASLPERFWLLDQRFPLAHEVILIWRRGPFAGLRLADAITHHDDHPHVHILRRLRAA